ncbi:ABC transporter ATP-binding protein [Nonomuraea sp. NPDC003754]
MIGSTGTRRLLWGSARAARRDTAVFAIAAATGIIVALALPATLSSIVDAIARGGSPAPAIVQLACLAALDLCATVVTSSTKNASVARSGAWLRRSMVDHILAVGLPVTRRWAAGDLAARMVGGASAAADGSFTAVTVALTAVTAAGAAIALWLVVPFGALVFLTAAAGAIYVLRRGTKAVGRTSADYQSAQGRISARLSETLTGARTIEASGTQAREVDRILASLPELTAAGRANWRTQGSVGQALSLLTAAAQVAMLALTGLGIAAGWLRPGDMVAAVAYVTLGINAVHQLSAVTYLSHVRSAADRISQVLDTARPRSRTPLTTAPQALLLNGIIVLDEGRRVLDGLDLAVPVGSTVAIVGRSGSGKSALARVAGGLLVPDEGSVTFRGQPVLPGDAAYAFEQPELVGDTIGQALALGRPHASPAQIARAAEAACAAGFIRRLPDGYATPLTGLVLSAGETQRLGVARAIVHDSPIVILDEATSSLDTATEAAVSDALRTAFAGKTRLVIAHRPAAAAAADLVVWLQDGTVHAVGTHRDLWAEAHYRQLFRTPEDRA